MLRTTRSPLVAALLSVGFLSAGCSAASYLNGDIPSGPLPDLGENAPSVTATSRSCPVPTGVSALAAGRLRNGAVDDLIITSSTLNELQVLRMDAAAPCPSSIKYPLPVAPSALALGLLDADAAPDVVVGSAADNKIAVLPNDGTGVLKTAVTYAFPGVTALAIGEVDGQVGNDVVALGSTNNSVQILANQGNGVLTLQPKEFVGGRLLYAMSLMSFGTNRTDLVMASALDDRLDILTTQGMNLWTARRTLPTEGLQVPVAVQAVDLTGDSLADLIVVGNNSNSISVMIQTITGSFDTHRVMVGDGPVAAAVADVDQNGTLDIAVLQAGAGAGVLQFVMQLKDVGSSTRSFVTNPRHNVSVGRLPIAVVAADLDGRPETIELVVADKEDPELLIVSPRGGL